MHLTNLFDRINMKKRQTDRQTETDRQKETERTELENFNTQG